MPELYRSNSSYVLYTIGNRRRWVDGKTIFLFSIITIPLIIFIGVYALVITTNESSFYPKTINQVPFYWISRAQIYNTYEKQHVPPLLPAANLEIAPSEAPQPQFKLVCYYNFPETVNGSYVGLSPTAIDPFLCTHLNLAFATIENNSVYLTERQFQVLEQVVALKRANGALKVLVSVGGYGNDSGFRAMVETHANRKTFIRSVADLVREWGVDGVDIDWEFPNQAGGAPAPDPREKIHFAQLLEEFREVINKQTKWTFLLSVAVAAPVFLIDNSYKVQAMNQFVDYVNVMTYDYHFYTKYTPFTGLNSPLYPTNDDDGFFLTLNINYTVSYWNSKGMDLNKMVIGIPTYGHTFRLMNVNNHGLYAPARGCGKLGTAGFADYGQICQFLELNRIEPIRVEESQSWYAYSGAEWISYENERSVSLKAEFVRNGRFGGAMAYSLNADDYEGVCHGDFRTETSDEVVFPLTRKMREVLDANYSIF